MKILFATPYAPIPGVHGGGSRMYSLMRELARENDIYCVTFGAGEYPCSYELLKEFCREVRIVPWSVKAGPMPSLIYPEVIWRAYLWEEFKQQVELALKNNKIDIVDIEYVIMAGYRPKGYPTVLTVHEDMFLSAYRTYRHTQGRKKWLAFVEMIKWFYFEFKHFKHFNRLIVLTENEMKVLKRFFPWLKIDVIPTGADTNYYFPRPDTQENSDFVFLGNFRHPPNVDAMRFFCRDILPRIKKRIPSANIAIVGYESRDRLADLAGSPGVVIHGQVDDIRPFLASSRVFVNPVRLGSGIRGKLLEAFAMARPVVSTRLGAQGLEQYEGHCFLVADTPEDFADNALILLNSKEMRRTLGSNARKVAEAQYDWKILAKRLSDIYCGVVLEAK